MPNDIEELDKAYKEGFLDGIEAYSWMRDGVLYVGMLLRTLKEAKNKVAETYNYLPPSIRKKR